MASVATVIHQGDTNACRRLQDYLDGYLLGTSHPGRRRGYTAADKLCLLPCWTESKRWSASEPGPRGGTFSFPVLWSTREAGYFAPPMI
jgi:hypothetical protein